MPIIEKNKQIIDENLSMKRHSLSHILAEAVQNLFPDALLGIGPAIENGFYYDFDIEKAISEKDIQSIQKEMTKIISQNRHFIKKEISIDEAKVIFRNKKEIYKLELIDELEQQGEKTVSLYYNGEDNWFDLCKGPHIEQSDEINIEGLKLDFVAGAYWKGSEKNKMMQRIYGLYFNSKKELDDYIKQLEEAKEKDHRKIGKELGIYMISDIVGKGLPMLLPKGATLKRILERWTVDEELKRGYEHIQTPVLGKVELYQISGHIEHYKDSMYRPIDIDGEQFILRPMSCPHHFMMYKSEPHSYRDLPLRYAEISPLYRYEKSGELSGLIRLRNFTLADAHIFCTKEQVKDEFKSVINLVQYMMTTLGIESKVWYRASLHDENNKEKYIDNPEFWEEPERLILEILKELDVPYTISIGDAAFYGPKVDVQLQNVYGKDETAFTIQIDYALPEKFDIMYIDNNGKETRPAVIHRSSIGCFERTIAFLLEHYAGKLPLWLSPIQIEVLAINDNHNDYVSELINKLREAGLRAEANSKNDTFSKKLRQAILNKTPYIAIIGDKEANNQQITLRNRETQGQTVYNIDNVVKSIQEENNNKNVKLSL